jgi:hypothetical protein
MRKLLLIFSAAIMAISFGGIVGCGPGKPTQIEEEVIQQPSGHQEIGAEAAKEAQGASGKGK